MTENWETGEGLDRNFLRSKYEVGPHLYNSNDRRPLSVVCFVRKPDRPGVWELVLSSVVQTLVVSVTP